MPLTLSSRCLNIMPSATLAMDARAKEMQAQGQNVIGFGAGEPDFPTPAFIRAAAQAAMDAGKTRYTPAAGTIELRRAISEKLRRENGVDVPPTQIVVSNGAKHSLFTAFSALLNEGDEVLIPAPCWVSYPEIVRMCGGVPVFVHGKEADGFVVSAEQLEPYITPRTKALVLNSPNNPNGCVWTRELLDGIARSAVRHGYYVVSDEVYEKLIYDGQQHVSIASLGEDIARQTVTINGMSKAFAMTGWRIGYSAGPKPILTAMANHQSHATSNPNTIAQWASVEALTNPDRDAQIAEMVAQFDARRKTLCARINAEPLLRCAVPKGAFYVMMNVSQTFGKYYEGKRIAGSMDFADLLLSNVGVAVVPGGAFEAEEYVRLSYAIKMTAIEEGMDRISKFLARLTDA